MQLDNIVKPLAWDKGRMKIEPAQHRRTCHKCGDKIFKGEHSLKISSSGVNYSEGNKINICHSCLAEALAIIKCMNTEVIMPKKKKKCPCGQPIYAYGFCFQCLEDMDERENENKRQVQWGRER